MSATRRTILSLFSGCGGLDLGFVKAGFQVRLAIDHWQPAVDTYAANEKLLGSHTVLQKSLALEDGEIAVGELPQCEVVLGGPPCQGFSFAGRQFIDDPRNHLYRDFVRIVQSLGPRVFLMENVKGMEAMALDQVVASFKGIGYDVTVSSALATNFGVAQRRERLMIVGFRSDLGVKFVPPNASFGPLFSIAGDETLWDAIGDLPAPVAVPDGNEEEISASLSGHLRSHIYRPLPSAMQRFVRHIPNGGCFRDAPLEKLPHRLQKILDDPARYRSPRLFPKPDPQEPAQTVPADTNPSLGGVLAPDIEYDSKGRAAPVAPQAHTSKKGLYTSPVPSRRITPREAARLQSFPDDFIITGSLTSQYRQIGNAVAVKVAEAFAAEIMQYLVELDAKRKPINKPEWQPTV